MPGKKEATLADRIDALVATGTHFHGEIVSRGTLRIDGWVEGKITTEGDVIIGESGSVSAQIRARNIIVAGRVKGNLIPSGHVEIAATASLEGDIQVG